MTDWEPTDGDLIAKYVELRDWLKADEDAHEKKRVPYINAMKAIETEFMNRMNAREVNSISADGGTAYRSSVLSVRTADKGVFLEWVKAHEKIDDMDVRPAKDAVKEWMDETGAPPPGVDVSTIYKINFRRA